MVVEEFIASAPWTFAKSMPSMPHEYVVSGKVPDDAAFDAFVAHIKEHGFKASWRGRPNTYLEIDGSRKRGGPQPLTARAAPRTAPTARS